ncbi:MAG: YciI family protein [Ramlibacter sp.]|nr:YciI family protein [Ramlibacter sp.]
MKYLCLAYYDAEKMGAMPPDELKAMVSRCPPKDAKLKATGRMVLSASLQDRKNTISMRPRGGRPAVTDGPFAESKELVGGFFIIEAADREDAIRIASLHPAATLGEQAGWGIELLPIERYMEPGPA